MRLLRLINQLRWFRLTKTHITFHDFKTPSSKRQARSFRLHHTIVLPILSVPPSERRIFSIPDPDKYRATLKDGKSLHVELTGTASDLTPVVFVHGLGGSSTNWGPLLDVSGISKQRLVLTFDLEGHGLSPLHTTNISIEGYADSVASVMGHVGIQRAVIVGHSMGGVSEMLFSLDVGIADWVILIHNR